MRQVLRLFLGVAAISPIPVLMFIAIAVIFRLGAGSTSFGGIVFVTLVASMAMYFVAFCWFIYIVLTDDNFDEGSRNRWMAALLFAFPVGAVAFWYRYVWHRSRHRRATTTP
jgi:hypothetical protein